MAYVIGSGSAIGVGGMQYWSERVISTGNIVISALAAGILLGTSAGLSPGPLMALVISQTLRYGTKEGIKVSLVPFLTEGPVIFLSTFVLARLADVSMVLGPITLAGAVVVAWLGIDSIRVQPISAEAGNDLPRSFGRAAIVNTINPHPYLFWATVGSPMLIKTGTQTIFGGACFVIGFVGCLVGSKVLIAVGVGKSRELLAGKPYLYLMRVLGLLLFGLAAVLLREGLASLGF